MTAADAFRIAGQYLQSGQIAAAEHLFRYVLELQPNHAPALDALGQICYRKGDLAQAIANFRRATQSDPANADYWTDLGAACCKAEAYAEGVTASEQAVRLRPDYAQAYNNLGYALLYQGKLERAVTVLEEAIRLKPDLADAYCNLGVTLKSLDRPTEAAAALEEGVRLNPSNADAANSAGFALQGQGKLDRAMEYYQHALQVRPDYADAMNNLATCFKEKGAYEEAVAHFRAVLSVQPEYVLAYYNLSELAAEGRYQFTPEEIDRLRNLTTEQHQDLVRSVASFAMGSLLDTQGAYDDAFGYFQQANDLRRQWLRANTREFNAERHRALADEIIATFDQTYVQWVHDWGTDTELPVFILGMPRSGTTLVEHIVASHPLVFGAGELGEFPRILAQLTGRPGVGELPKPIPFPNQAVAQDVATRYLRTLTQLADGIPRVTVKLPENFLYLGLLATLFPRARVIYCRRDPRDVCLSCYFNNFQNMSALFSFEDIAVYYREYERLMEHWKQVLPLPIHEVRYENLLANQESVTRGLIAYCGLDWDDRCLTFYNSRRVVQTASTIQVRRPLSTKSMGRWKHYESHLGPLMDALRANEVKMEATRDSAKSII